MKRVWSVLLCLMLVLSLAACGGDSNETEATTSDGYKTDKNAKAEDIFTASMQNLSTTLKNLLSLEAEATQLSFDLKGNAAAVLSIPMLAKDGNSGEIALNGKAEGSGLADNKKGASLTLKAETDAMKALGALMGGSAGGGDEDLKVETAAYLDLEGKRAYAQDPDSGKWTYEEFDPAAEFKKIDTKELDELAATTLEKLFETHTFTVEKEQYVIEGTVKVDAVNAENLPVEEVAAMMEMVKDLKPTMKMTINPDKKITGVHFSVKDYSLDLSEMLGAEMTVVLKELSLELGIKYETVSFAVPDEVKKEAEANR